ncbi:MAG TPA: DEAD/DEAH box helicase [Polyangiaceae bacterium]|nr:DEAD/DEAH box helicase [Polyangiaceae bacterium]
MPSSASNTFGPSGSSNSSDSSDSSDSSGSFAALAAFHSAVRRWFGERLGEPTLAQRQGWPAIRAGKHTLIAAPTGSGKTLAAFLSALDQLFSRGAELEDRTQILYISPLKALASDIQKNLELPLSEIRALDPSLPELRVCVRTGDTSAKHRASMIKRPPHILVTTPESAYILLTSQSGRQMLSSVRTVIVDEIHALARDKRGSHLSLSLERLEALTRGSGPVQRIGLSATQKPLEEVARFLVGVGRECVLVDSGHLRNIDLDIEVPPSPLTSVCSHEVWEEIYQRVATLVREHRTTLVFVNTRKMAERVAARLGNLLGSEAVACHHGSLAAARRHDAEQRLKQGQLQVLVATASLELGIDIGDVDLVIQLGASRSIATLLQRVGRAGHGVARTPKGRIFPLTLDELVEAAALLRSVRSGVLDRTPQPGRPLDILAQQVVAACVAETWDEEELFQALRRAWPYRDLSRAEFDEVVKLHLDGRWALLHRDGIGRRLRATRRARLTAVTSGGAIADNADYQVILDPEGTLIGSLNEDFAIESNGGDIFQLGTASWRILRVSGGVVRVADARGAPPTIPFWLGEAPARTRELSAEISTLREQAVDGFQLLSSEMGEAAARQLVDYASAGARALGAVPTQSRVVLERFFDESGGMQLVIHAPFGGRINRAWGLALRKRFCRGFGFELQAAANEEAIVLSLGPQHSFPLEEVFDYLHPQTARELLVQALLPAPMFKTRWRWNVSRALLVERMRGGKRTPPALLRMRADDLLAASFPAAVACGETLPPGDIEVPMDQPLVRQTVDDCLNEAMDVEGFLAVLRGLRDGSIARHAVDSPEPSLFAHGILAAQPYSFLDDAPLEERRTQAVFTRRTLDVKTADELGALDPEAIRRVREEAWPAPTSAEEVHEALLWMGYVTRDEAAPWADWIQELVRAGRVVLEGERYFAHEASRNPKEILRGRLEALGPIISDEPLLLELEAEGFVLRGRFEGRPGWCSRRLLARIHRYTLEGLRKEIEPVTPSDFLRFLATWQHVHEERKLDGPRGVLQVIGQLSGFELPASAWESSVLPARVRNYKREWLDELTLSGEVVWGRIWGSGAASIRNTPICLVPRDDLEAWLGLASAPSISELGHAASVVHGLLRASGALFIQGLQRASGLHPDELDEALAELIARGLLTCDSFGGLRALLVSASKRRTAAKMAGRWSLLAHADGRLPAPPAEFVARQLLQRTGVVFRKTVAREKQPLPWRELVRVLRSLEARGEVRGGRFVAGFDGEQYALPEAVPLLRAVRRRGPGEPVLAAAADPLNFRGILTPDERISPLSRQKVLVA